MKIPRVVGLFVCLLILTTASTAFSQDADAARDKTRERLGALHTRVGPDLSINFKPSSKSPFVFTGMLRDGLKNADSFEIVISVTTKETIGFRIFPHYKGGYINIDKARNTAQLLRKIAQLNDTTFLFWGADDEGDVFTGYTSLDGVNWSLVGSQTVSFTAPVVVGLAVTSHNNGVLNTATFPKLAGPLSKIQ